MTLLRLARNSRLLAGTALLALLAGCAKKNDGSSSLPTNPMPGPTATVTGLVIGASGNGLPLPNVAVSASPSSGSGATSNSFGVFNLTIPANTRVAVTGSLPGFVPHPTWIQLAPGETRTTALVLMPIGGSLMVPTSSAATVVDPGSKSRLALSANFATGTPNALVRVTGIDPSSQQVLAMPGTYAAQTQAGSPAGLEPVAIAEIDVGDGAGGTFPLALPAQLELHLPAAYAADARLGTGLQVSVMRYDVDAGLWKYEVSGSVAASTVDGQPSVHVTVNRLGWFAAGFLYGTSACVQGVVTLGGSPLSGVSVQAYPGSAGLTNASGVYQLAVPPETSVRLVATRSAAGSMSVASGSATSLEIGAGCVNTNLALSGGGPPPKYLVEAQLLRARLFGGGVVRDAATVRIMAEPLPHTLLSGARVELVHSGHVDILPLLSPGVYGIVSGQPNLFTLASGDDYTLRVDLEPDGIVDGEATIQMPGRPTITAPVADADVDASFVAGWTDPLGSNLTYSARYIGWVESTTLGTVPAIFALPSPTDGTLIGNGVGQPQYNMPNDPLISGPYLFRLWATNGPVRFPVGATVQFADPNMQTSRLTGWFSAIARGDSVSFNSLGSGL